MYCRCSATDQLYPMHLYHSIHVDFKSEYWPDYELCELTYAVNEIFTIKYMCFLVLQRSQFKDLRPQHPLEDNKNSKYIEKLKRDTYSVQTMW